MLTPPIFFDAESEAINILEEHTKAYMCAALPEFDTNKELYECVNEECAFILTQRFVHGGYTPMQYNAVRNELAKLLWRLFNPYISAEQQ